MNPLRSFPKNLWRAMAPERVEVLDSGQLALSTGSVRDPKGKRIGTFTSIWRKEAGGQWHILFDKGDPASDKP
jgi:ketosteroid isomerase-like protein